MDEAAEKAARKAAKKARKAERRAAAAAAGEAPDDATVPEPSKKQKKRAAEGAAGEAAEAAAAAAHNAPAAAGQPVLSGKKAKKAARNGAGDVAQDGAAPGVQDVDAMRTKLNVAVENEPSGECYAPVRTFEEVGFPPNVLAACAGFKQPSPIQAQCWPIIMLGRDLIGIAATGSGKTLAFMLPALVHIAAQPTPGPGEPLVLVLAPTRELAMQTAEVGSSAGEPCGVRCACVYGGAPKGPQKAALRGAAQVVVATPGRLQDLMQEGALGLSRTSFLVLDEADRMLDLGFEPAIRALAGATRADRQTLMFSATWPQAIQSLASEFLAAPLRVRVGGEATRASASITQVVEVLEPGDKNARLEQLLVQLQGGKGKSRRCLIFVLYKKEATAVAQWLHRRGWPVSEVQGDMPQAARTAAVAAFKDGSVPLLVATDVAARGLDIPGVESVINYTFPLTIEDYIHRVGRTGRAGATGYAHTFFTVQDKLRAGELANVLREGGHPVPPELSKFGTHVKKKESKLYGAHFKEIDASAKGTKITFD